MTTSPHEDCVQTKLSDHILMNMMANIMNVMAKYDDKLSDPVMMNMMVMLTTMEITL